LKRSDIDNDEQRHLFDPDHSHGMLQIAVTDTGIGIKIKDQEKLFKLFGFV
jgi:signal transduction histidine kinase